MEITITHNNDMTGNGRESVRSRLENHFLKNVEQGRGGIYALGITAVIALAILISMQDFSSVKPLPPETKPVRLMLNPVQIEHVQPRSVKKIPDEKTEETGEAKEQKQQDTGETFNKYLSDVVRRIEQSKRYPAHEKYMEREGSARVRMVLQADGSVSDLSLLEKSVHNGFNQEALNAVRRASPFPPFPDGSGRDSMALNLRIHFRLQ